MITQQEIVRAAQALQAGQLVAFPTETVYGLGANALDPIAVAKIFEIKGRPQFDPLIVHVAGAEELAQLVLAIPEPARELVHRFWPGPLSLVLPKRPVVPDIVTAGLPSVAVRCPDHELARELIRAAGVPLAAPSANRFGRVSPTRAEHVREQFGDQLPHILDGGPCRVGVESTVVSFVEGEPLLLRPGGVTLEELETVVGRVRIATSDQVRPAAPGMLPRHYAPNTPVRLTADPIASPATRRLGLLTFQPSADEAEFAAVEVLSEHGSLREAAANLFAALRRLDQQQLDAIIARPLPETGLGRAIMDRLRRAARSSA